MSELGETATLRIERSAEGWPDRYRAYEVMVNGTQRAKIRRGERCSIEVEPGSVEVFLKIDWCTSRSIEIEDLAGGAELRLACRPRGVLTALYRAFVKPDDYMLLEGE